MESGSAHPPAKRTREQRAVQPSRQPEVRKRQQEGRVDEQVRPLLAEPFRAAPPVANPLSHSRQIAYLRRAHTGVLDEKHTMAGSRQPRHYFLVSLPDEVPVDRGHAEHVRQLSCHRVPSVRPLGDTELRRETSSEDTVKSVSGASE